MTPLLKQSEHFSILPPCVTFDPPKKSSPTPTPPIFFLVTLDTHPYLNQSKNRFIKLFHRLGKYDAIIGLVLVKYDTTMILHHADHLMFILDADQ